MSWSQDYSVPSVESLLEHFTLKTSLDLLREELKRQGITITDLTEVLLDDGFYQEVKGIKVALSDDRVFVPKLVEKFTADRNYGCDTYKYVLESETPEVKYTDGSYVDESLSGDIPPEYGLTDEADPASDGVLEGEVTVRNPCGNCNACGQGFGCDSKEDTWDVENDGG